MVYYGMDYGIIVFYGSSSKLSMTAGIEDASPPQASPRGVIVCSGAKRSLIVANGLQLL